LRCLQAAAEALVNTQHYKLLVPKILTTSIPEILATPA